MSIRFFAILLLLMPTGLISAEQPSQDSRADFFTSTRRLSAIEFHGSSRFDSETLREQLRMTREGDRWDPKVLEADIEMNLKSFLKTGGFLASRVTWESTPVPGQGDVVRIRIQEGPQYRLGTLRFQGNTILSLDEISDEFDLKPGDIVDFTKLKRGLEAIKRLYEDRGYINWSYLPEQSFDGKSATADFSFTIEEGIPYHIGYVGFVGVGEPPEEDRLRSLIALRAGDVFASTKLDAAVKTLNGLGLFYRIAERHINVDPFDSQHGIVGIVISLRSRSDPLGEPHLVRRITIRSHLTSDMPLRAALQPFLEEGEIIEWQNLEAAVQAVNRLGLFEAIRSADCEVEIIPARGGTEGDSVDVTFHLKPRTGVRN